MVIMYITDSKGDNRIMTTLSIVEARNHLADAINRVTYAGERILFARRGKPVAALVSAEDLALLQRMEDAEDIREAAKVLKRYERAPSAFVTLDEYKRRREGKA
jgi:prevent-host-death family protein